MYKIIKNITISTTLLIILFTIISIIINENKFFNNKTLIIFLYVMTKTVSFPYLYFIGITLLIILMHTSKVKCKLNLLLFLSLVFCSSYLISELIKIKFKYPRPCTRLICKYQNYMKLHSAIYERFIKRNDLILKNAPSWLIKYWYNNNTYSFPSKHSVFVTDWVLIFIIFIKKKYLFLILFIKFWAIMVMVSRIILEMHWFIDVITGIAISFLMVLINYFILSILLKKI